MKGDPTMLKKAISLLLILAICCAALITGSMAESGAKDNYTLDRVVVLSRHNIRSPLSGSGSLLGDITPHEWFDWTSNPSELSLRGGVLETMMGQYFRLWLEKEGLFPENYQPEEGEVRFYANAKQRTLATARYFSAGLLPVAEPPIEYHGTYDTMDPTFEPSLNFVTDEYAQDALAEIVGENGFDGILADLNDAISLLMDTADIEQSESYQAGTYGDLLKGETVLTLTEGKEPSMTGPIKNATSVADAMILQYYEEADEQKAAFGHDLSMEEWQKIHSIVDTYTDMLFCSPMVSVNVAHPLLQEIRAELTQEGRKFSFLCGHDANIASVLAALNYGDYLLPDTVEQHTPIGVKLVFERWVTEDNEAFYKINLVYQSTQQLRGMEQLTLDNPPVIYPLCFEGADAEGMIAEVDLLALLDGAIGAYDALVEKYTANTGVAASVDYADPACWAYYGDGENKDVDAFLICPTVDMNDEYNMSMEDEATKASFLGALNMERGIYTDRARMFAPYYRQAAMKVYALNQEDREPWMRFAYTDVSAAFAYYLEHENQGRPIILAGFSQGADMCYRLLEEYFGDEVLHDQLVAVYAIGWPCSETLAKQYPQIVPASGPDDLGVVISFDCEAPGVEETFITPAGKRAYAINPLNWKTDGTPAEKAENLGSCFTNYSGEIKREETGLCGCFIDETRGVLKVTDIDAADYPPIVPGLPEGAYHVYDYQFFFRNLQQNVNLRIERFIEELERAEANAA